MVIMCSLLCIIVDNFQIQAHGGSYSEGLIIGGIFAGGAYFRNVTVLQKKLFLS